MELFIDNAYEGLTPHVKIPPDFQAAFENDPKAFEIYNKLSYPDRSKCINKIGHYKNPEVIKNNIEKILTELKTRV